MLPAHQWIDALVVLHVENLFAPVLMGQCTCMVDAGKSPKDDALMDRYARAAPIVIWARANVPQGIASIKMASSV